MTSLTQQDYAARYGALFDQIGSGIFLLDRAGVIILVNQHWCDLLGFSAAEMIGRSILEFKFDVDQDSTRSYLKRAVATDCQPYVIERQYRRHDGSGLWVSVSVSSIRNSDGHVDAIMALATDISARKQGEAMNSFLADLADKLAIVSGADEIVRVTTSAVGAFLDVDRCYFVECMPDEDRIIVGENWVRSGTSSLAGEYSLFAFGGLEWWQKYSSGDLAINNIATDPLTSASLDNYAPLGITAYAVQPFRREGPSTTILGVTESAPREWSPHEMATLRHVIARVWPLIERARSEAAFGAFRVENDRRARLHETIMSGTPDLMYAFDLEHRFTYANTALLKMWGKTWDESIGKTCLELGYPEWHAAMHDREIEQVKATGQSIRGEVPFTGTDGERIYDYIFSPVFGADGMVESVAGTTRDVTERRQSLERLEVQTARRELLAATATTLLTSDDPKRMIEDLFARIAPALGIDQCYAFAVSDSGDSLVLQTAIGVPDAIADSVTRVAFGEGLSGTVAKYRKRVVESRIQESIAPYLATTRRIGVNACACFPLIADGRLLATLAFASTTRETLDSDEIEFLATASHYVAIAYERLRLISELRKAAQHKDDFIALLAHELRNPLAPIRNGLEVMRVAPAGSPLVVEARRVMERQLGHMVRLIEDLLDISRITLSKLTLRRERIALADVLTEAIEGARPAVEAAGHTLSVSIPDAPIYLDADLTRLAQVFTNLLTNSAKYSERGGTITVTATSQSGRAIVTVRDTGIGIPTESLPHIFDMFSQIDRSIERTTGGLGIGLALVRGLVSLHQGTVSAWSEGVGRGSTFTVDLPTITAPALRDDEDRAAITPGAARRVLVVDDNRDAATSMQMMLQMIGNDVRVAHDGVEAVAVAADFLPELILMDVGMPRLNGYDATRQIRAAADGRPITIVALTGWGQESDRAQSRDAGCDHHLVKPVSISDLHGLM